MTTINLAPYDMRLWNATIGESTPEETAALLVKHYEESKKADVEKMNVECMLKLKDASKKVIVSIRHNFRGLFSKDLQEKGMVEFHTNEGFKKKYHIQVTSSESQYAQILSLFLLRYLTAGKLINHSQSCIITKTTMSLGFKPDGSPSEIFLGKV